MRPARGIHFLLIPIGIVVLLTLLGIVGAFSGADGWIFDALLRLRPSVPAARNLLLVDIDSRAVALAGPWPWTRDVLADGLVLLKEMDARYAVLDLPLAQRSPLALDPTVLRQTLPDALNKEFSQIGENIQSLFDAIRRGAVRPKDAAAYVADLVGLTAMAKVRLLDAAMGIERDDDALLGQAAAFFGQAYVSVDLLPTEDPQSSADLVALALDRMALPVSTPGLDPSFKAGGIRPAVLPVVRGARGGGFAGDQRDADGVRRRTFLTALYNGRHIGQVAFTALLDLLGNPTIEAGPGRALLRGATLPGAQGATIAIPLTKEGHVLLNWPRGSEGDGFRHLSWADLILHQRREADLVSALRTMDSNGYLSYLRSSSSLLDVYENGARLQRGMLAAGNASDAEEWRAARALFFSLCDQFLNGDAEARIIADADRALQMPAMTDEENRGLREERDKVPSAFADARRTLTELQKTRTALQESVSGSFCIASLYTAQGLAPAARTPFGAPATNAAASAALVTTVLSGEFLRQIPTRYGSILAFALSLLVALLVFRLRPGLTFIVGCAGVCVSAAGLGILFLLDGSFLSPLIPSSGVFFTGAGLSALQYWRMRRMTRAARAAFSARVSKESLRVLTAAPDSLAREGERRSVTVLSLAERGLSAGVASHSPGDIVKQLTAYRTGVDEVIRSLEGMVGGVGGDRLTAFFGAPRGCPDHARRACLTAVRIRAVEKELNVVASPAFLTRMGIDTGECIVGSLGAKDILEYAVVGAPSNLAARLEAQNARFGTSILISEKVREAAGPGFLTRKLDKVRFAGAEESVRLFELIAERSEAGAAEVERIGIFEEGLDRFENGDFPGALVFFSQALAMLPSDGPAAMYAERCRRRREDPLPPFTSFPR